MTATPVITQMGKRFPYISHIIIMVIPLPTVSIVIKVFVITMVIFIMIILLLLITVIIFLAINLDILLISAMMALQQIIWHLPPRPPTHRSTEM